MRRNYAETTIHTYEQVVEDFDDFSENGWTTRFPITCDSIMPIYWELVKWSRARWCCTLPRFVSFSEKHSSDGT